MTSFKPDTSSTYKEEAHKRVEVVRGLYLNHTRSTKVGKRVLAWVYILLGTKVLFQSLSENLLPSSFAMAKLSIFFKYPKLFMIFFVFRDDFGANIQKVINFVVPKEAVYPMFELRNPCYSIEVVNPIKHELAFSPALWFWV